MRRLTAILCLTLAVLLGSAGVCESADLQKGLAAWNSGDYATALRELKPLAEQGDAYAQNNLGSMYESGHGVPQDNKTAVKWYRLAAEQGDADAQKELKSLQREIAEASAELLTTNAREFLTANPGTPGMLDIAMSIASTEKEKLKLFDDRFGLSPSYPFQGKGVFRILGG